MSRSLAAAPTRRRTAPRGARKPRGAARPVSGLLRPLGRAAGSARAVAGVAWQRRWPRFALLALLIAAPVLVGGWMWLRHSSLVTVQRVEVSGVRGPDAARIDAALVTAAHHMSTLDVHAGALRAAAAPFAVVREVTARARFPHALDVHVVEQLPVAALVVNGSRTAVAADGIVLGPGLLNSSLPSVNGYSAAALGRRVAGAQVLAALSVLGAAPAPLARLVERVYIGPRGLTVAIRGGLLAYFGDATRPHAKWFSLARVLADPSSAGASYVDVRLPARPAAGFPAGVQPPGTGAAAASGEAGATESTVASLAAALRGAGAAASPSSTHAAGASGSAGAEASSETGSAAGSSSEAGSAAGSSSEAGTAAGSSAEAGSPAGGEAAAATEAESSQPGATTGG